MGKTVYVVGKLGFEYNDEIYTTPESDSLIPRQVFEDKAKAINAWIDNNLDWLANNNLNDYSYNGIQEVIPDIYIYQKNISEKVLNEWGDHYNAVSSHQKEMVEHLKELKKKDIKELIKLLDEFEFLGWVIREVEFTV